MITDYSPGFNINPTSIPSKEYEIIDVPQLSRLQTPREAAREFAELAGDFSGKGSVGLETMQIELSAPTEEIFRGLKQAKKVVDALPESERGQVDLKVDRVSDRSIWVKGSQALIGLGGVAIRTPFQKNLATRTTRQEFKTAIRQRRAGMESLIQAGILDPRYRKRGEYQSRSHNHSKTAYIIDEVDNTQVAWLSTANMRHGDFDTLSNLVVRTEDAALVEGIRYTSGLEHPTEDKIIPSTDGRTDLLFDAGVKGQSIIYDTAMRLAQSLEEGDSFTLINQYAPVEHMGDKSVFGELLTEFDKKLQRNGVRGKYLISPSDKLHPVPAGSRAMQKRITKKAAMINRGNEDGPMQVVNLARPTHAKVLLITRANGEEVVMIGSHNFTKATVNNGTRESAFLTTDPELIDQIKQSLDALETEVPVSNEPKSRSSAILGD